MSRTTTWSRTLRRSAAAAVVPLALVSLNACGGEGDTFDDTTGDESSQAADTSVDAPSESASESTDGSGDESTDAEPADVAEGEEVSAAEMADIMAASFENATTAQVTLQSDGAMATEAEGEADFSTDPYSMDMTMELGGQSIDMVLLDNVIYMSGIAGPDTWVEMDLDDPNNPMGSMMTDQMDPRTMFDALEGGIKTATYEGQDDIDGDTVDAYSIVLDGTAMLDTLDPELQELAKSQMPKTIAYDIFIDEDGLFRRAVIEMGPTGTMTMTYDNWGDPVDIQAPPAGKVQSMDDLMGGMSQPGGTPAG